MTFEIAFVVFLVAIIISRVLTERAMTQLSIDQKVSLLDAFGGLRAYGLIPIAVLIATYYLLGRFANISDGTLSAAYFLALLAYVVWNFFFVRTKLSTLGLPNAFLNQYSIARTVQYPGLGFFLVVVIKYEI